MNEDPWEVLLQISGSAQAEIFRGFLEAQGIRVFLSQEGIGQSVYPVTVGPLSEVQILVPARQLEQARQIMAKYEAGEFEDQTYSLEKPGEPDTGDQFVP